jgi:predicted dehydrogenase
MTQKQGSTRREFIRKTAVGAAAGWAATTRFGPALGQVEGANDRIGVGFIGCGGRAGAHMGMVRQLRDPEKLSVELVAACDVYKPRLEGKMKQFGIPKGYADHRELLADPDVDLVCIATPDHLHGFQALDAIRAGKDIYCEKPVTHWTQFELTRELADAVAKSDRVFQLGTQAMSDAAWRQMKQLVKEGLIGQPIYGETGFFRTGDWGERGMPVDDANAKPGPDLNWEAFLGSDRPKREFSADRFFRWRLFEDYAGGPSTDLYPHCLTQVLDILGVGFPDEVVGMGSIARYDHELREVPDTFSLLARYPEKVTVSVIGTQGNDYQATVPRGAGQRCPVIRGWEGSLTIDKNTHIAFTPVGGSKKEHQRIPIERGENNVEHWKNLLACCRSRSKATWSPMDLAFRTQAVLQMAMLGWRAGKTARFDAARRAVTL